jgi:hypothetical protein
MPHGRGRKIALPFRTGSPRAKPPDCKGLPVLEYASSAIVCLVILKQFRILVVWSAR